MNRKPAIGIGFAAIVAVLCFAALASGTSRTEKPATNDVEQYADFIENEIFDIQDMAEGAEIQRRRYNRMTPPGFSWVQPMFPPVVPFDAENFDEQFLDELLGEEMNSVAIYPLSLTLDPKTRNTLVFNAEGKLIATLTTDRVSREWPEDADPSRVTLQLDLLPAEDVEPYLYAERRIAEYEETQAITATKSGGMALRSLGASEFGIAGIQRLTNGNTQITVTNGAEVAELYSYTVWHTSTVTTNEWVDEYGATNTSIDTLWTPISPPFNGIDSEWECLTTNLFLSGGVGVYEDTNSPGNARVRFYAVANRLDSDGDGLTDGAEIFLHRTDPGNPDTDGDGWSDAEELAEGTDPLDRFSATHLARGVVLNEVLYNPPGANDLGSEWIELYSAGRYPVDLGGFVIQVAETAFINAYVFPSNTWIDPGRYLLLGGTNVANHDLEVNFQMPNRFTNDPTAAVRLAAVVGTNTFVADCLMYGGNSNNFNPHGLDTTGWVSSNARSAGSGNSLYRLFAGHDTDQVQDWQYTSSPTPNSSADFPDSDGDGLTDQEELTGSQNPYGEPTNRHNADSDGDGLSDYDECITYGTNPNTWATDGDIYPWPPETGGVTNWPGSDSYEIAHGWDPLVFDENTNGIPDSWEMAFPGTNLYAHADDDGISNIAELMQNSNPWDDASFTPQPYVTRYEYSKPGWVNNGQVDVGLNGWVKVYFENLNADTSLCLWVNEGNIQEEFRVEWHHAEPGGTHWLDSNRTVITSANALGGTRPYLLVQDLGLHPNFTGTLGGEYELVPVTVDLDVDTDRNGTIHDLDDEGEASWTLDRGALVPPRMNDTWSTNSTLGLAKLVIQPMATSLNQMPDKSMRIQLANSVTRQYLWMVDEGGTNISFDGNEYYTLPLWPSNGATFYAASSRSRKYNDGHPVHFNLELELLISNQVICSDSVQLTVAPLILPPECFPAEKVYSTRNLGISGITFLSQASRASGWAQDLVKFTKCQAISNSNHTVFIVLESNFDGGAANLDNVLRYDEGIPGLAPWLVGGHGGSIMATPPLPNAPYGWIMLGNKNDQSRPIWEAQNIQPIVEISTDWLWVGHVDEIFMWISTNKVLYADPWVATDLLHTEIVAGRQTGKLWFGLNTNGTNSTIAQAVIATNQAGYKLTSLPSPGLSASTNNATLVFPSSMFSAGDILRVGSEILSVISANGPSVTVARAQAGRPPAAHSPGGAIYAYSDVVRANLPVGSAPDQSVVAKISAASNQLRQALGAYPATFIPMPVLFGEASGSGTYVAYSANVVNCLVGIGGTTYYPYTGCSAFENDIQTKLQGAQPCNVWELFHCNAGEIHCATATIRSIQPHPPWWNLVNSWE